MKYVSIVRLAPGVDNVKQAFEIFGKHGTTEGTEVLYAGIDGKTFVTVSNGDDPDLANGGQGGLMHRLQAVSKSKFTNPSSYTKSLDTIMTSYSGVFHLIDRKLFSVPKMALFPHLLIQQPLFVATALPISMALDACQAAVVSVVTQNAQSLTMESQRLNAELTKIRPIFTI